MAASASAWVRVPWGANWLSSPTGRYFWITFHMTPPLAQGEMEEASA